ncbi:hypothetical protein GGF41_008740, partial [Coemansia sp. RSA 2531]
GNTASNGTLKPQVSKKTKVSTTTFVEGRVSGKIGGSQLITPTDHSKWIILARVHVGDLSQDIQVLLDSGATHSVISRLLAETLSCVITKLPGSIHMAKVGMSYPRIGQTEVMFMTSHHAFWLLVEVFPGAINPPVFFGVEVLNHFATSSLMLVLLDQMDHPLAASEEPDVNELPPNDDSRHHAMILAKLAD